MSAMPDDPDVITGLYWWAVEHPDAASVAYAAIAEIERLRTRVYDLTTEQTIWEHTNTALRLHLDALEQSSPQKSGADDAS